MAKKKQLSQPNPTETLDRLVFYGFLAIAILIPLVISRITFDQFDIVKVLFIRILTFIMLGVWIWKILITQKKEIRWTYLDFLVLAFIVLAFISTLTSIHLPTAIHGKYKRYEGLLTFINYGILYFLGLQTLTGLKRLSTLSKVMAFTGGAVALYGVLQYIGLDPLPWSTLPFEERRSFSTFGNPDLLGGYLVIVLPIAIAEFLKSRDAKDLSLTMASMFLILVSLLTTFTRGAWLGAVVASIVFVVVAARAIFERPKRIVFILVAFVCVFAFLAVYSASTGHDVLNLVARIKSLAQITEGSAGTRIEIWKAGLEMAKDYPLFGMGPDTFRLGSEHYETSRYVKLGQGKTVADNAHNYIVQIMAGVGIPAVIILMAFFALVMYVAFRYSLNLQSDEKLTVAGFIAAFAGYFVHLLFGVSITGSTGILWIIIPALVAVAPIVKQIELDIQAVNYLKVAALIAIIIAGASASYAVLMYVADYNYAKAITMGNGGNEAVMAGDYEAALAMYNEAQARYEKALSLYKNGRYFDGYGMFLERFGVAQQDGEIIKRAADIYSAGMNWEPYESDHYVFLAGAQAKMASKPDDPIIDEAIANLNKALTVRPYGLSAHMLLANIYFFKGDSKSALKQVQFVAEYDPMDVTNNMLMGKIYEDLGKKKEARQSYERVLAVQPDHQDAKKALSRLDSKT